MYLQNELWIKIKFSLVQTDCIYTIICFIQDSLYNLEVIIISLLVRNIMQS